jgi:hypothetical protein
MAMRATTSSSSVSAVSPDDPADRIKGTITWAIPRFLIAGRPLLQQEWNSPELIIGKGKDSTRWYLRCSKGAAPGILNPGQFKGGTKRNCSNKGNQNDGSHGNDNNDFSL